MENESPVDESRANPATGASPSAQCRRATSNRGQAKTGPDIDIIYREPPTRRYVGGDVASNWRNISFLTRSRAWSLRTNIPPFGLSAWANSTQEWHRRQVPCALPRWLSSSACNRQCGVDCLRSSQEP